MSSFHHHYFVVFILLLVCLEKIERRKKKTRYCIAQHAILAEIVAVVSGAPTALWNGPVSHSCDDEKNKQKTQAATIIHITPADCSVLMQVNSPGFPLTVLMAGWGVMEAERWRWERHVGDKVAPSFELTYWRFILALFGQQANWHCIMYFNIYAF